MKLLVTAILLFFANSVFSLEIDEKLTLRIVNTSVSKKTILINRGVEDGLAKGDHAKFFVSVGVIARGVAIKVSPTRSVWSIYRIVNKDYLRDEQVLKLKITPAVKITKDESQMLVNDDLGDRVSKDPRDIGIPLADGANDLDINVGDKVQTNIEWMNESSISLVNRNKEVFGMVNYSSYSQSSTASDNSIQKNTQTVSDLNLRIGGEYYFKDESKWYSRLSLLGYFGLSRRSIMAYQGATVSENSSNFGFGTNLYLFTRPSVIHKFIPYLNYTLSLGSISSEYITGNENTSGSDLSLNASIFTNSFAFGYKYYTTQGIGIGAELAFVLRGETYASDSLGISWTNNKIGPRLNLALSYRF